MSIVSTTPDTQALTLTIVADFAAPPERVWQVWADPRQLERWWGPPTWPATVTTHDLTPGGTVSYYMTGPDGEKAGGWWRIIAVDEPRSLEFADGFADADGNPDASMPVINAHVTFAARRVTTAGGTSDGTRMTVVSSFESAEQMQQLTEMGMVEGMGEAMGQIDGLLAA